MKIKNRWMRWFFGLDPAPVFVVVPASVTIIFFIFFTDKASIKRLKAHASDYGQRIGKMERQITSFAMKDSVKPISFAYSFYSGKEEKLEGSEEGSNAFERETKRHVSSSFVQMDDVEVDLASMNDEEYQDWIMGQVPESDRPHLEEMFQRQKAFKESLTPVQKQALDYEVATTYSQLVAMSGGEGKLSSSQKSALRRNAEFVSIMQWGMRESAERQKAEVRERIRNQQRPEIIHAETTFDEEKWKKREAMRQLREAARGNGGRR